MTDSPDSRTAARRAAVEREILDAAWQVMAREGAAALSVREVARSVGIRQQSLTYYFPTKQELLDALFADGFADLRGELERLPADSAPVDAVVAVAATVVDYCVRHPARYQLMLQRSVPGFEPSANSYEGAGRALSVLSRTLADAGVDDPRDVALVRCLISGVAAEQIANDPDGREFAEQTERGVRALLSAGRGAAGW